MTEFRKKFPSSWAERQGINSCVALTAGYDEGLSWQATFGMEFAASNGIIQVCPLSVLLLNLLMNTWARSVKAGNVAAMPKVYADDAGDLSKKSEDFDVALKITGCFARVTQQKNLTSRKPKLGHTATARPSARDFRLER